MQIGSTLKAIIEKGDQLKEYIYLDSELVNSYLAQLDEGVLTKAITGISSTDSHSEDGGQETTESGHFTAGIGIISGKGEISNKEIDKFSTVYSKSNSDLIETALDDYSLDILLKKLVEKEMLNVSEGNIDDGELIFIDGKLNIFNFELLKSITSEENISNLLIDDNYDIKDYKSELKKITASKALREKHKDRIGVLNDAIKGDSFYNFSMIERFANFTNSLFPDSVLFKIKNSLIMCTKENIRINIPLLTQLSLTNRNAKILGIVIAKKTSHLDVEISDSEVWESEKVIADSPVMMMDIAMRHFGLSEIGDYYVRPIAIYYEKA